MVLTIKAANMITEYSMHEINSTLPDMSQSEFRNLIESIRNNGLREAIWLDDKGEKIIDGRHRYLACKELGIEPTYRIWDGIGDMASFVFSLNVCRQSFTTSQAAMIARNAIPLLQKYSKSNLVEEVGLHKKITSEVIAQAAAIAGVSSSSVKHAIVIGENGAPELEAAVFSGAVSVSAAAIVAASFTHKEQVKILAGGKKSVTKAAKFARDANAAKARGEESPLSRYLPNGTYRYKADYDYDTARGM
ncbi:MAG: ParB-like [Desulfovibrionaceae bacterium]|nr:MAG: ParB-like [Desulfovibrionaceae bacterium]